MRDLHRIAGRLYNQPLLTTPANALAIDAAFRALRADRLAPAAMWDDGEPAASGCYANVGGVAIIPVSGTLIHKAGYIGMRCGNTGYDGIGASLEMALADPAVRAIAFDFDSPGGEISGCHDLAAKIRAARGPKPIWAIVDEVAASAAYWLASACDKIVLTETAFVGSIGVVGLHMDQSAMLADAGIKPTFIFSGAHKIEGNSLEPLPESVRAKFQSQFDGLRDLFCAQVALGRGSALSADAARATEADIYRGADAVTAGLADAVASAESALDALIEFTQSGPA